MISSTHHACPSAMRLVVALLLGASLTVHANHTCHVGHRTHAGATDSASAPSLVSQHTEDTSHVDIGHTQCLACQLMNAPWVNEADGEGSGIEVEDCPRRVAAAAAMPQDPGADSSHLPRAPPTFS